MSAIFGLCRLDGAPVALDELAALREVPGDADLLALPGGRAVLACGPGPSASPVGGRLLTTAHHGSLALVADVRIDNRAELVHLLRDQGATADTPPGELLLLAYREWGETFPSRLLGDFAFALWDGSRRTLVCATDPLGVRQLYLLRTPALFACASRAEALLALPGVDRRLDERWVAGAFCPNLFLWRPEITPYRGIERITPGTVCSVSAEESSERRYWEPPLEELRLPSDDDYLDAFREALAEAVRCRLPPDGATGATLSGGLDSSSVTCLARDLLKAEGRRLHTFRAVFPTQAEAAPRAAEDDFVDAVLRQGDIDHHPFRADLLDPFAESAELEAATEEPCFASQLHVTRAWCRTAREHGCSVLLTGVDGDTVVSHGYEDLYRYLVRGRIPTLLREARALAATGWYGGSPTRILWKYALRGSLALAAPSWAHRLRRQGLGRNVDGVRSRVLNPRLAREVGLVDLLGGAHAWLRGTWNVHQSHLRALRTVAKALQWHAAIGDSLGVDPRHPFLDRRVVELCLRLPPGYKLRDGWSRWILRRSLEGILPPEVQWRQRKGGLGATSRLLLAGKEQGRIGRILHDPRRPLEALVDYRELAAAWERFRSAPLARATMPEHAVLFTAYSLDRWLRRNDLLPVR